MQVLLTPTHLAIVMEYAAGGELFERICNAGRFSEDEVVNPYLGCFFFFLFDILDDFSFVLVDIKVFYISVLLITITFWLTPSTTGEIFLPAANIRSELLSFYGIISGPPLSCFILQYVPLTILSIAFAAGNLS